MSKQRSIKSALFCNSAATIRPNTNDDTNKATTIQVAYSNVSLRPHLRPCCAPYCALLVASGGGNWTQPLSKGCRLYNPRNCSFPGEIWTPIEYIVWFLGSTRVCIQNGTLIGSAVFAGLTVVTNTQSHKQRHRQTTHIRSNRLNQSSNQSIKFIYRENKIL